MIHQAKRIFWLLFCNLLFLITAAQPSKPRFTRADSLRGSMNAERAYDVLKYDIRLTPDFENRSIRAKNTITYRDSGLAVMQIDLQVPLEIDSIVQDGKNLQFQREGNVFHVSVNKQHAGKTCVNCIRRLTIYYHGNPQLAQRPPWDGGFIFTQDKLGRPWMTVACEGTGASVWYPCKDWLGDEPDSGAILTMVVPDSLVAIGNGRLVRRDIGANRMATWTWAVTNPINNYNIIPYIGKYVNWKQTYYGQKGTLDCSFWVLDYDMQKAFAWYLASAKNGNAEAAKKLSDLYFSGRDYGGGAGKIKASEADGLKWLKKAAGRMNGDAQQELADRFSNGNGVTRNLDQAIDLYKQATANGSAAAARTLGRIYGDGLLAAFDGNESLKWYFKAHELENLHASSDVAANLRLP